MEYLAPAICGLLLILGLVGVIMSRKIWRIPQMLLVIGILIGSVAFFWLAARTLRTRENWQHEIAGYRDALQKVEKGTFAGSQLLQKGIEQLQDENAQLNREVTVAMSNRGRVWHNATRVRVSTDTGAMTAKIEDPTPLGIDKKMVLFVFDGEDRGGKYLGEFVVTNVNNNQVELSPSMPLVQSDLNLIQNSRGPWVLYEIMPVDERSQLAKADGDIAPGTAAPGSAAPDAGAVKAPADAGTDVADATKSTDATKTADAKGTDKDVAGGDLDKSHAPGLRDYAHLFRSMYRARTRLLAENSDLTAEAALVEAAVAGVQEDVTAAKAEKGDLEKDLQGFQADLAAVTSYVAAQQTRIAQLRAQLSQAFRSNIALSAELAQIEKRLFDDAVRRNPQTQASNLRSLLQP